MLIHKWVFILLCIGQFSFAQRTPTPVNYDNQIIEQKNISEDNLKSYKLDDDFNYVEIKQGENIFSKIGRWFKNILTKFWESIFGSGTATGFLYFVFYILPWIILVIMIFLLVRFFLKVNANNIVTKSKSKGTVSFSEEEQIIKNEDIPALIKEAVQKQNYRLAIRYYYLLALKYLTDTEYIIWEPQKTNEDYIKELSKIQIKSSFKNITKIYDYVWYGEFEVDAIKFESLKLPFEELNNTIIKP